MWKKSSKSFLLLALVLFGLMSLSDRRVLSLRGSFIASFSSLWGSLQQVRNFFSSFSFGQDSAHLHEQNQLLLLENELLKQKLLQLQNILQQELAVAEELAQLQRLEQLSQDDLFYQRRRRESEVLAQYQMQAIPAKVIFRGSTSWHNSLWINVGSLHDSTARVLAKNSPVVVGHSVIGVIDYVGEKQSRVRLITDSGLHISVRAARGSFQNRELEQHLNALIHSLQSREDFFEDYKNNEILIQNLRVLQSNMEQNPQNWLLAKGEIYGSGQPMWRSSGQLLKGVGFNYDFNDEEGKARDLRTGKTDPKAPATPLLKINDLLITTGMDGIFPAGLHVATITKIEMLKEGSYTYELTAKPTIGSFDELTTLFVLPSLGFTP